MRLRFTRPAAYQLDRILTYIEQHHPSGARQVSTRILRATEHLVAQPLMGALTARPGLRRIIVMPYPYVVYYRVRGDEIVIHAVRHTARHPF